MVSPRFCARRPGVGGAGNDGPRPAVPWEMPLAKTLRAASRLRLEDAILIRRMALALSPSSHRDAMLEGAARLHAEAEALEAEASELDRKGC